MSLFPRWLSELCGFNVGYSEVIERADGEDTMRCGDRRGVELFCGLGNSKERSILGGRGFRFESFIGPFGCLNPGFNPLSGASWSSMFSPWSWPGLVLGSAGASFVLYREYSPEDEGDRCSFLDS